MRVLRTTIAWIIASACRQIANSWEDDTFVRKIVQLTTLSKHFFASKTIESPPFPDLHKFTESFKTTRQNSTLKKLRRLPSYEKSVYTHVPGQQTILSGQLANYIIRMQRLWIWPQLFTWTPHSKCPQNNQQQANGTLRYMFELERTKGYASCNG